MPPRVLEHGARRVDVPPHPQVEVGLGQVAGHGAHPPVRRHVRPRGGQVRDDDLVHLGRPGTASRGGPGEPGE